MKQCMFILSHLSRAQFRLNKLRGAGACDTCCIRTVAGQEWMNDHVHSLIKMKLMCWTLPCQERFKYGAGDPVVCKTAYFIPVLIHEACAIMRVSVVPGKLMLLIDKDTLQVSEPRFDLKNNIGFFQLLEILKEKYCEKAAQVTWESLGTSPSRIQKVWEFHDSFVPSETAGPLVFWTNVTNETFSVQDHEPYVIS